MREPPNYAEEMKALKEKADELKRESARRLGELVVATGARELPPDVLAGALLDLVGRYRDDPAGLSAFAASGAAFFRGTGSRRRANGRAGADAAGPGPGGASGDALGRPA